ncbi:MAG: SRPBCC family protein [Acidimicrobiales bacterium]|jgi:carbon monoxide dehydrogenase subunit G|nr:MxaD family protein [Acidimicrobiaceae bacterium]MDP6077335.1 SRPBCC family protein [Acidimicrobiales bacterium]MDP7258074.1 SRPBCC family protein [Acidimicrobiales bacterium]HJO79791.1 SRPBCC family protein [Acidimicrobiales bacterium]
MTAVERSRLVDATPVEVWKVLSEFETISSWAPNVEHSCVLTGKTSGVGTARRVQVGRSALLETIIEWEEMRTLSYSIGGLPPVIRSVTNTWRLEPTENGTKVRLTTDVDAGPRPPQKLIAHIVGRKLGAASDEMLLGLAAHLSRGRQRP